MSNTIMSRTVRLGDIDVSYSQAGQGDPVVLIHGLAEDQRSWSRVQQAITGFTTYAYDIRGHGKSSLGESEGSLEQLGEDLIRFLETVTGPAKCVGYSLGGTVVLWAAKVRPDLVRQAVVIGTSSKVGRAAAEFFANRIEQISNDREAFQQGLRDDTRAQLADASVDLDLVVSGRLEAVGEGGGYINAAHAMTRLSETPLTPILREIRCPVDIISGAEDMFCPKKAADIMLAELPNSTYHEISGAGHLMSVDRPEAYVEAIKLALTNAV